MIRMKPAALAFASLLAAGAFAQVDPNRTVLIVNGEAIKGSQYYTRMEVMPGVGKVVNGTFVPSSPGFLALQAIIDEILMIQLAKKDGVSPTEAEIDAEVAERKRLQPEVYDLFIKAGMTDADFRYDTLVKVAEFKIVTKGVNVTDFEIDNFYKSHARRFTTPKTYTLRAIMVNDVASQGPVDAALKAGETFESVAAKFSTDGLTRGNGGLLGKVEPEELRPAMKTAVEKGKKGDITAWVKDETRYFKFKIDDIQEAKLRPLDDQAKKDIRRQIMLDKGMTLLAFNKKMAEMRKTIKIEFQGGPFDETLKKLYGEG